MKRRKFLDYFDQAIERIKTIGLSPSQIELLKKYGLLAIDNVTGFYEGRSGAGRLATLKMAIQHIKETGEEAFYVEMDLKNLSGLNAALGHAGANEIFVMIAAIVRRELSSVASDASFYRHGGDEMSAYLVDTTEHDVRTALIEATRQVARLATCHDLDSLPHPKHDGDDRFKGIGVHFGISQIKAHHENNPTQVFSLADRVVETRKALAG